MTFDPSLHARTELLLRQRVTLMINRYELYAPQAPGSKEEGELLAFVEQKRLKLKEEINFWKDRSKNEVLFTVKAEKVLDPAGTYQLINGAGQLIGRFKKDFVSSFARSTYIVQDSGGNVRGVAKERNLFAALVRRYGSLIPYIGELIGLMPIAYNFDFTTNEGVHQATVERIWAIRDRYRITIADPNMDRRMVIALAVCMDALQRR